MIGTFTYTYEKATQLVRHTNAAHLIKPTTTTVNKLFKRQYTECTTYDGTWSQQALSNAYRFIYLALRRPSHKAGLKATVLQVHLCHPQTGSLKVALHGTYTLLVIIPMQAHYMVLNRRCEALQKQKRQPLAACNHCIRTPYMNAVYDISCLKESLGIYRAARMQQALLYKIKHGTPKGVSYCKLDTANSGLVRNMPRKEWLQCRRIWRWQHFLVKTSAPYTALPNAQSKIKS